MFTMNALLTPSSMEIFTSFHLNTRLRGGVCVNSVSLLPDHVPDEVCQSKIHSIWGSLRIKLLADIYWGFFVQSFQLGNKSIQRNSPDLSIYTFGDHIDSSAIYNLISSINEVPRTEIILIRSLSTKKTFAEKVFFALAARYNIPIISSVSENGTDSVRYKC